MLFMRQIFAFGSLILCASCSSRHSSDAPGSASAKQESHSLTGVVRQIKPENQIIVISHEAVPDYMSAMTMLFKVRDSKILATLQTNTAVTFRLNIQNDESWIDQIKVLSNAVPQLALSAPNTNSPAQPSPPSELFTFTNQFGQAVNLTEFRGQPLGLTFFFTRCPVPDYCPRLSKNFQEASEKLASSSDAPTNWHFLSITIDPDNDTPAA